jgi:poly[(R)-3-hydroxyalkanoate] polymerase subunit PhaC
MSDLVGVTENPIDALDPVSFLRVLARAGVAAARNPLSLMSATTRLAMGEVAALNAAARRALGGTAAGPVAPAAGDKRFSDVAFEENWPYFLLEQQYLLAHQFTMELLDASDLAPSDARKAHFAASLLLDALAPTNTLPGNPAAIRKAFDTGGNSVVRGTRNFVHDIRYNGGWPSQVDSSPFEVGVNTAATRGKVVYRSPLIELLQYEPQTPQVHEVPLLFCPPWINKYYIMDLAPGKSLIEWAINHHHTCFAISYRNPDESMRDTSFDDYLMQGPLDALRVVRAITGAPQVNTLSVCLGGTLTAMALAYQAVVGEKWVNSATFLNSLTDFSEPGVLGAFTDEATVLSLEKQMAKHGYLDATQMARTFDSIRANDLVFHYVVNNWLLGEQPPAFDLLAWNADSTRMPAKMHSTYLRSCYIENLFARGELIVDGHRLDPGKVDVDAYLLSAIDDHIVPWQSAYKTTHLLGGDNRFVLSTSGHIAGIVNPPSPKAKHWTNDVLTEDPDEWLTGASLHDTTWWEDWARWIGARAGERIPARKRLGNKEFPPLEDAPGTYVRARS